MFFAGVACASLSPRKVNGAFEFVAQQLEVEGTFLSPSFQIQKTVKKTKLSNGSPKCSDPVWHHFITVSVSGRASCPVIQELSRWFSFFGFIFLYKTSVDDLALYVN